MLRNEEIKDFIETPKEAALVANINLLVGEMKENKKLKKKAELENELTTNFSYLIILNEHISISTVSFVRSIAKFYDQMIRYPLTFFKSKVLTILIYVSYVDNMIIL